MSFSSKLTFRPGSPHVRAQNRVVLKVFSMANLVETLIWTRMIPFACVGTAPSR